MDATPCPDKREDQGPARAQPASYTLADPGSGERGLAALLDPALDAIFAPPPLMGVVSAWYGHVPFAAWLIGACRPRCLVELGTYTGVSYAAFCEAVLREGLTTRCYAVDTWEGDDHSGFYGNALHEEFRRFHDAHYPGFSVPMRTTFDQALGYIPDGAVDLLHIDGLHTYEAVRHDFEQWRPKLSPRGVVLLHDTNVREREFGVWRLWQELRAQYPGFEFLHGHGLGLLLVGPEPPALVAALCATDDPARIARLRGRFAALGQNYIRLFEAQLRGARLAERAAKAEAERDAMRARLDAARQHLAEE